MGLPDYVPPAYEAADTWNSRKKRMALMAGTDTSVLHKEDYIRSCLMSETSSVLADLSGEAKIRAFADKAAEFHENLIGVMNLWAVSEDKEYARDGIWIDDKSASSLMWEYGLTFTDVVVGVQEILNAPERFAVGSVRVSVHGPDSTYGDNLLEEKPLASGMWQRLREGIFGARQETPERRTREELFAHAGSEEYREHNRECLRAEQAQKKERQKISIFVRAERLLTEKEEWSQDMAARAQLRASSDEIWTVSTTGELICVELSDETAGEYSKDAGCYARLKDYLREDRPIVENTAKEAEEQVRQVRQQRMKPGTDSRTFPSLEEQLEGKKSGRIIQAARGRFEGLVTAQDREERLLAGISREQEIRLSKEREWKDRRSGRIRAQNDRQKVSLQELLGEREPKREKRADAGAVNRQKERDTKEKGGPSAGRR